MQNLTELNLYKYDLTDTLLIGLADALKTNTVSCPSETISIVITLVDVDNTIIFGQQYYMSTIRICGGCVEDQQGSAPFLIVLSHV